MSDYEDDFENYDDDFEVDEDYEVLPKSMAKPMSPQPVPVKQAPPSPIPQLIKAQRPTSGQPRVIEIPQAPLLSDAELKARNKRLLVSLQKMKQLQLQVVVMDDLFMMAPLTEYDLYMMARGQYSKCKVSSTQTNDDAKEEESQTDEIFHRHFASQVPDDRNRMTNAEDRKAWGGRSGPGAMGGAAARVLAHDPALDLKLARFMQWAGPAMLAALGMPQGSCQVSFAPGPGGALGAGMMHLAWPEFLAHRPVTAVSVCTVPGQAQVMVAYGPVGAQLGPAQLLQDHSVAAKGCLCVWDLAEPTKPRVVLVSEAVPACCAWAPAPTHHVVVAGMEEGGVCAWDLEEPASRHPQEKVGKELWVLRRPSFTSEAEVDPAATSPICGIACVARQGNTPGGRGGGSASVVALGAFGEVAVFALSVAGGADGTASASDTDLGVRVGSRVRLLRSSVGVRLGLQALQLHSAAAPPALPCHCLGVLQGVPGPSMQLLVGSEGARTLRGSWLGTCPAPKQFLSVDAQSQAAVSSAAARRLAAAVTSIDPSPFCPQAFLVGMSDGSVALHLASQAAAVQQWPEVCEGRVVCLRWLPTRPACFMALDSACVLHFFEVDKSTPVLRQAFMVQSGDVPSLTTHLALAALQPQGKAAHQLLCFALGYDDGSVDVHQLVDAHAFPRNTEAELKVLRHLLGLTS